MKTSVSEIHKSQKKTTTPNLYQFLCINNYLAANKNIFLFFFINFCKSTKTSANKSDLKRFKSRFVTLAHFFGVQQKKISQKIKINKSVKRVNNLLLNILIKKVKPIK